MDIQTVDGKAGAVKPAQNEKTPLETGLDGINDKKTARKTRDLILLASVFFFLSIIFLILTEIGSVRNKAGLTSSYFLKIDVTDILPSTSATDAVLVNSIARSLGIHDFYQVGLWNFCEGYNDEEVHCPSQFEPTNIMFRGVTHCSKPQNLYWFNPVQIILSELLAGATITLPAEVITILKLIRIVSKIMFGFFMVALCLNFVFIFLTPIVLYSRWYSYHFVTFTFISALFTFVGSAVATAMYVTFQKVITSQKELNIGAKLGAQLFAFMWIGTAFSIAGWIVHFYLACVSRKVHGSKKKGHANTSRKVAAETKMVGLRRRLGLPLARAD